MLELDYAFLADYATVDGGKLTAVGASFTRLRVVETPTVAVFAIAGRIRTDDEGRDEVGITLRVTSPGEAGMTVEATNVLDAREDSVPPYRGRRRGLVFSVQVSLPVLEAGLYKVEVDLEDTERVDRELYFDVLAADAE